MLWLFRLLDRVRDIIKSKGKSTVPYDEDHNAAFYRLPAGIRRAQKEIEKEEEGEAQFSCDHICKSEVAAFYLHFLHAVLNNTCTVTALASAPCKS